MGLPLFFSIWSLSLSCFTGLFPAPPSQMTSGLKLDVNLTIVMIITVILIILMVKIITIIFKSDNIRSHQFRLNHFKSD